MATRRSSVHLIGDKELQKTLKSLGTKGNTELKREVKRTLIGIKNQYKEGVKNNIVSGDLEKSIKYDLTTTGLTGSVYSDVQQSIWIEFGTKAHLIKPKSPDGVLAFKVDGDTVFSKSVQHPGTRANPVLLKAWLQWMVGSKFADRLRKRFERIK